MRVEYHFLNRGYPIKNDNLFGKVTKFPISKTPMLKYPPPDNDHLTLNPGVMVSYVLLEIKL